MYLSYVNVSACLLVVKQHLGHVTMVRKKSKKTETQSQQ